MPLPWFCSHQYWTSCIHQHSILNLIQAYMCYCPSAEFRVWFHITVSLMLLQAVARICFTALPPSLVHSPSPFFVLEIVVLHWCHTWQWEWAADRRWRSRTILLAAASCYYEVAVMWNWILSQNTCLWDYAPALAIKVRVLQAGRIWCSVKFDATSSPIWVFLNKLELAVWLISVHIAVTLLKLC